MPATITENIKDEHIPTFPKQDQDAPGDEHKMDPAPDFGADSYVGKGRLQDKVALITGADSGIGRAIALAYAREGAHVAISYLKEHKDAETTQHYVTDAKRECLLIPGDLSKDDQCKKVIDETVKKFGRIDILVSNASFQGDATDWKSFSRDRVQFTFDTNIIAMFRLCQLAVDHMKPGSAIITTASVQGYKPNPQILDYAMTKGAIITMTKGLGKELPTSHGIRVNCIAPGPVWTPLIVESFPKEKVESFGKGKPMDRPAQPKEFAGPAVFLACTEESSYVSGSILGVTGGDIAVN